MRLPGDTRPPSVWTQEKHTLFAAHAGYARDHRNYGGAAGPDA
ncbi:hypothetical protein GJA_5391 [Janthinobacterium agaricidamnosum NBRC 102515 = DSM 9628]|uniref:Uncharacterized protein n=1 Tax=Janthinobacterium agaricidamnosum NBRC 102515 = DSM 9628 TaxID=1349767 RepID=W0VF67_9BURK|nr:hypothetical protein GJA_5391 [Janthinobacterium agaricidamnosum NBRC 102515 = DSM 9628]